MAAQEVQADNDIPDQFPVLSAVSQGIHTLQNPHLGFAPSHRDFRCRHTYNQNISLSKDNLTRNRRPPPGITTPSATQSTRSYSTGIGGVLVGDRTEPYLARGLSGTPRIGGMVAGCQRPLESRQYLGPSPRLVWTQGDLSTGVTA
jgi:hypothetical protein